MYRRVSTYFLKENMQKLLFQYQSSSQLTNQQLHELAEKTELHNCVSQLQHARSEKYATRHAALNVPFDTQNLETIKTVVQQKQQLNPKLLIVVGIGGSCLGAKAIQEALLGRYYNAERPALPVYFAQTVDADRMATIMRVMTQELQKGNAVIVNVITKSGTTTETIANFQVLLALLQQYRPDDYQQFVVVTTDKDSVLWRFAQSNNITCLEIPKLVGGRYSVFTAVGLFPLLLLGIDADELLAGAQQAVHDSINNSLLQNSAQSGALINYFHYQQGLTIHDLFLFAVDLEGVGKWYRQLVAESLGKEHDITGKKVWAGITPTVSLGSVDLHSVAQLYLGGPRDKFTTFVTVQNNKHEEVVPNLPCFNQQFAHLVNQPFSAIMDAIAQGTQTAYLKNNRPFCSVILPENREYYLGYFLQLKMIEVIYLGFLLQVDPFDQPNVELYKKETHELLQK